MEKEIIGKNAKIIWDDGNKILVKEGLIKGISKVFIGIKTRNKTEMIPLGRIVRIELEGGNKE